MTADEHPNNPDRVALLTRREIDWLLGKISRDYENHLRHRIRRKLKIFYDCELPLLACTGYLINERDYPVMTTAVILRGQTVMTLALAWAGGLVWLRYRRTHGEKQRKRNPILHSTVTKINITKAKWAGSDPNQRPPPCQGITTNSNGSNTIVASNLTQPILTIMSSGIVSKCIYEIKNNKTTAMTE